MEFVVVTTRHVKTVLALQMVVLMKMSVMYVIATHPMTVYRIVQAFGVAVQQYLITIMI